jgi:predicted  nucleic acid-binding Zn-ribbon protein
MRIKHLASIDEQRSRVKKLEERLIASAVEVERLQKELVTHRQELFQIDSRIKLLQQQKDRIFESDKIASYQSQIEELEDKGLELLTLQENTEIDIKDQHQFSSGLQKTINEINGEAQDLMDKDLNEVKNLDMRLNLIVEELPENFKSLLTKLLSKNLAHGPFTRIESGSCYFCRYKISRLDESEVEGARMLKTCPQCSRIFLPYGT